MDSDNDTEENFPTASLDDPVWCKIPIPDRDLCIHMAVGKSETSYPSQISTPSQEPINKSITQEEPMDSTESDIPDLIDILEDALFQHYLLLPWI